MPKKQESGPLAGIWTDASDTEEGSDAERAVAEALQKEREDRNNRGDNA